jgi:hypothetical protein
VDSTAEWPAGHHVSILFGTATGYQACFHFRHHIFAGFVRRVLRGLMTVHPSAASENITQICFLLVTIMQEHIQVSEKYGSPGSCLYFDDDERAGNRKYDITPVTVSSPPSHAESSFPFSIITFSALLFRNGVFKVLLTSQGSVVFVFHPHSVRRSPGYHERDIRRIY